MALIDFLRNLGTKAGKQVMFNSIISAVGQVGGVAMTGGAILGVQALKNKAGGGVV